MDQLGVRQVGMDQLVEDPVGTHRLEKHRVGIHQVSINQGDVDRVGKHHLDFDQMGMHQASMPQLWRQGARANDLYHLRACMHSWRRNHRQE